MPEPRENLTDRCPRCNARRVAIQTEDGATRTATARYACGSAYLAFEDSRLCPVCVGRCMEPLNEPHPTPRVFDSCDSDEIPDDFETELLTTADLAQSFRRLRGLHHYHAETLRGRIRSLQLRVADAWKHFERAHELGDLAADTVPDLVRLLDLHVFCIEHALLAGPVETRVKLVPLEVPEPPRDAPAGVDLDKYPELVRVLRRNRAADALGLLYAGSFDIAAETFEDLIEIGGIEDESLAMYYVGLAACEHSLGDFDLASETLENAALATQTATYTLNRARAAAALCGVHAFLGHASDAEDWRGFLRRLDCPEATKRAFLKRGERIRQRSACLSRLIVF